MKLTDIILVGDGIAGFCMAHYISKAGLAFKWFGNNRAGASKAASGIINPVSGLRYSNTFGLEAALPITKELYGSCDAIKPTQILDFLTTANTKEYFLKKIDNPALSIMDWSNSFPLKATFEQVGCINEVYQVDLGKFFESAANQIKKQETFDYNSLELEADSIKYNDIVAEKIIFCDGYAPQNIYTKRFNFKPNKGQALIINCPSLKCDSILKHEYTFVPLGNDDYWVGASFEWEFEREQPTTLFLVEATNKLKSILKTEFKIKQHLAGIRPSTADRIPFVGFLDAMPQVGILNGLGTKGVLWAPWMAKLLTENIVNQMPIPKEMDVNRKAAQQP